jgi:hypothetical protein
MFQCCVDGRRALKGSQEPRYRAAEVVTAGRNVCVVNRAGSEKHRLGISQQRQGNPDQKAPTSRASKNTRVVVTNSVTSS